MTRLTASPIPALHTTPFRTSIKWRRAAGRSSIDWLFVAIIGFVVGGFVGRNNVSHGSDQAVEGKKAAGKGSAPHQAIGEGRAKREKKNADTDWPVPAGWKKLSEKDQVWVNAKEKQVLVGGQVCLTEGVLEMFACPQQTKEHESIVAVDCQAFVVHTALLAVGAQAGHPVRYQPKYEAASGTEVDIFVLWKDAQGKEQKMAAREWIRQVKSGKPLDQKWVFAGSLFWQDPANGKSYYQAEGGEFICVSNFGNAMLDLPIESSDTDSNLLFNAFTEKIPARGTPVRLLLVPQLDAKQP